MFKNLFFKNQQQINKLGRWGLEKSNIKLLLANIDSCGDTMCGDLANYRKEMDKELIKIKIKNLEKKIKLENKKKNFLNFFSKL